MLDSIYYIQGGSDESDNMIISCIFNKNIFAKETNSI